MIARILTRLERRLGRYLQARLAELNGAESAYPESAGRMMDELEREVWAETYPPQDDRMAA